MEPDYNRSLIPRPSHELAAPKIAQNRILGEMVESSLALVKKPGAEAEELEALICEARRLQGKTGMTPDNIRAFNLFLRAAKAGHPAAQFEVSVCYSFAAGTKFDLVEADRWCWLAAEAGYAAAQNLKGNGLRNERRFVESFEWFRKAAEQGHSGAQMSLSDCYREGEGVPKDYCLSYAWARLAADADDSGPTLNGFEWSGPEWAEEWAKAIASVLSPAELERAHGQYLDFKRKYSPKR